jgi:hypothetical protein
MGVVFRGKSLMGEVVVIHAINNADTARALANAIYSELGLGWIDIDDADRSSPIIGDRYDVTKMWLDGSFHQSTLIFHNIDDWKHNKCVVAFRIHRPYSRSKSEEK